MRWILGGRAGAERRLFMGAGAGRGARQAARRRQALRHHVDRRQAWRGEPVDGSRRHPDGPGQPRPSRPGLGGRRGRAARRRRDGRPICAARSQPAGRRRRDLHRRRRQGELEVARSTGAAPLMPRPLSISPPAPAVAQLQRSGRAADRRARPQPRAASRRPGADRAADHGHGSARAPSQKKVVAYAITGISNSPIPIWATEDGKFSPRSASCRPCPVGYEDAQPVLEKAQDEALAARSPALARRFLKAPAGPDRLHQRPRLRRRQPLRRGADGGGRQGQDRRRRAGGKHPAARGRPADRRQGQDARPGPVGRAHAFRRRQHAGRCCSRSGSPRPATRATSPP